MKKKYLLTKKLLSALVLSTMLTSLVPVMPVTVKAAEVTTTGGLVTELTNGTMTETEGNETVEPEVYVINLAPAKLLETEADCTALGLSSSYIGYYAVSNADQLYWFAALVNGTLQDEAGNTVQDVYANVVLTNDIVVNKGVLDENGELRTFVNEFGYTKGGVDGLEFAKWTPIGKGYGSYCVEYYGNFDGNNHKISGLYSDGLGTGNYSNVSIGNVALIGNLSGVIAYSDRDIYPEVKNVGLTDTYFKGQGSYAAAIVGECYGRVSNCYNEGCYMYGYTSSAAGVVAYAWGGEIVDCYNTGYVYGYSSAAGICVNASGIVFENCYNTGDINGHSAVGGICGTASRNNGIAAKRRENIFSHCYNTGNVTAREASPYGGGIVGAATTAHISDCYNTGYVSVKAYMNGGIAGYACEGTIRDCYNLGTVEAWGYKSGWSSESIGGIVGYAASETITDCYNAADISGGAEIGGIAGYGINTAISNCYNTAPISGGGTYGRIGGIAGECANDTCIITNSYNAGAVVGKKEIGNITGYNQGTIANCYWLDYNNEGDLEENMTPDQFATGEVAYKLAQGCTVNGTKYSGGVWGQLLGVDKIPVFSGDIVYRTDVKYCDGVTDGYFYSNTKNTYGTAHFYKSGVCTECGAYRNELNADLAGHSLVLNDKIAVNFYMVLDESVLNDENAYMQFTLSDGTTSKVMVSDVKNNPDVAENGDVSYVFTCEVAAKDMETEISAQMFGDNGASGVWTYSVKKYADAILSDSNQDEATKELVQSMIDYGTLTQSYFSSESDSAEEVEVAPVEVSDLANYAPSLKPANIDNGVTYYGSSLILESGVIVRHYFTASEDAPEAALEGLTKSGNYYYVDSEGVSVKDFATMKEYNVAGHTITYSPLSYVRSVLGNSDFDGDTALKNVLKSMYHYYMASVDYKGAE